MISLFYLLVLLPLLNAKSVWRVVFLNLIVAAIFFNNKHSLTAIVSYILVKNMTVIIKFFIYFLIIIINIFNFLLKGLW